MTTHGFRLVHLCHVSCDEKKPHPCHEEGCTERVNAAYPAIPPSKWESEALLASATDLLNSWAREMAVKEAYDESDIKGVIDRLWNELSTEMSRSAQKGALIRQMLKDSPNPSVQNVLDAIEGS